MRYDHRCGPSGITTVYVTPTLLDTSTWTALERSLAGRLEGLADDEFISIAAPPSVGQPPRKRGLAGRLIGRDDDTVAGPFVQARRIEVQIARGTDIDRDVHAREPLQERNLPRLR